MGQWILAVVMGITISSEGHAFEMELGSPVFSGAAAGDLTFQATLNSLANAIKDTFNSTIASSSNESEFLKSVGNANATAARSFTSPGTMPSTGKFFMSVSGAAAISLSAGGDVSKGISFPKNQLPPIGFAGQTAVTVGVGAGSLPFKIPKLDANRIMYSLSFATMDLTKAIGHGVSLKSTHASVGMAYQVYVPQAWTPVFRYNGIKISSALSYSKFDASYKTPFTLSQTDTGSGSSMVWDSNIDVGVSSYVLSLSNEVTTGVRAFWLFSLYTGLGLDLNFGSSSITGGSSGPVVGTAGGSTVYSNTASVVGSSDSQAPVIANTRFILGAAMDVGKFGLHLQGTVSTPATYGLNFGAHLMF